MTDHTTRFHSTDGILRYIESRVRGFDTRHRTGHCPAHDDENPSFSVKVYDDHVGLKCFTGCETSALLKALGLEPEDLWIQQRNGPDAVYRYEDENGQYLYEVVRLPGKRFRPRHYGVGGKAVWGLNGIRQVLYRLPQVKHAIDNGDPVFLVEGEKDADTIVRLGLCGTTVVFGANAWKDEYAESLHRAHVIILPDNDEAGRQYAARAHRSLRGKVASVKIVNLPDLPEKGDVSDWVAAGGDREALLRLVDHAETNPEQPQQDADESSRKLTITEKVIQYQERLDLFVDRGGDAYASFEDDGALKTVRLRSKEFRLLLRRWYSLDYPGRTPGSQALQDAIAFFECEALFSHGVRPVFLRVGTDGERACIDLANGKEEVLVISPSGCEITRKPPVPFVRHRRMVALPRATDAGDFDLLWKYITVRDEMDRVLLLAFLVYSITIQRSYPLLVFTGPQGSGKTTATRIVRQLIDPSSSLTRSAPRNERDLLIATRWNWVLAFENLSGIPPWLSDALCRLSTGGGIGTRTLHTDDEETVLDAVRPVILNGIPELIGAPDLADRSLPIQLDKLPSTERRSERQLWGEFKADQPRIQAAMYQALSVALERLPEVKVQELPRMADFALFALAAESALPFEPGTFMRALETAHDRLAASALEGSLVGTLVQKLLAESDYWTGTATELLEELRLLLRNPEREPRDFPKSPIQLSNTLSRIMPALERQGIIYRESREPGTGRRLKELVNCHGVPF